MSQAAERDFWAVLDEVFVRKERDLTSVALASPSPARDGREAVVELRLPELPRVEEGAEARAARALCRAGEWGPLTGARLVRADERRRRERWPLSRAQLCPVQRTLLAHRFDADALQQLRAKAARIAAAYDGGLSALQLSRSLDAPPLMLMRAVLAARGLSRAEVRAALARPRAVLGERDASELEAAAAHDALFGRAGPLSDAAASAADGRPATPDEAALEAALVRLLAAHGVSCSACPALDSLVPLRPEGLRPGQEKGGAAGGDARAEADALATPGATLGAGGRAAALLLRPPVRVGGRVLRWAVASDSYASAADAPFLELQVPKLRAVWGGGLLVFSGGVARGFHVQDCVAVGATAGALREATRAMAPGVSAERDTAQAGADDFSPWLARKLARPMRPRRTLALRDAAAGRTAAAHSRRLAGRRARRWLAELHDV